MHVNNHYALRSRPTRSQYDDSVDYYAVRCPYCNFTSARMTFWSARETARRHEAQAGHDFFHAKIYRADSKSVIESDRETRRFFY